MLLALFIIVVALGILITGGLYCLFYDIPHCRGLSFYFGAIYFLLAVISWKDSQFEPKGFEITPGRYRVIHILQSEINNKHFDDLLVHYMEDNKLTQLEYDRLICQISLMTDKEDFPNVKSNIVNHLLSKKE